MAAGKSKKRATHKLNGKYAKQFDRTAANKKRRQARHFKNHPNDTSVVKA